MSEVEFGFGFRVGHWTDENAMTGCTVLLPPRGNVTSCDIRGSSPGSRELDQLHPERRLTEVHGLLLTGGSAFGLAAADGVMGWLEEHGIGYEIGNGVVPIVPTAVIFDLGEGSWDVRPGADAGRAACEAATPGPVETGRVGAGTGATVGKWAGRELAVPGGIGIAHIEEQGSRAAALAVVNSVGDVVENGGVLAGAGEGRVGPDEVQAPASSPEDRESPIPGNTVLAVVAVEATLDKREVRWLAARGSDGITISVSPAHTRYDGDVVFAVAVPPRGERASDGSVEPDKRSGSGESSGPGAPTELDILGRLATMAVAEAVRSAVR